MSSYDFEAIKREVNKSGKLVFDIETTGKTDRDQFVAVGYMWKRRDGSVVNGHFALALLSEEDARRVRDGEMSWRDVWRREDLEMRCFTEFWQPGLLPLLEQLQHGDNVVHTEEDLAMRVNKMIAEAEAHWDDQLQIVTNTTAYDTCWLHRLLVGYGLQPLDATRSGKHRWTYDADSFSLGLLGETPDTVNWRRKSAFDNLVTKLPVDNAEHDHHPANDAKSIFASFEAAEIYQAMVPTTALTVLSAPDETYETFLEEHIRQVRARFSFMRQLSH